MSNRRKIFLLCFCGLLLVFCRTTDIPQAYDFRTSEIKENPYGSWIKVTPDSLKANHESKQIAGELICIESDSLYILESDFKVKVIPVTGISHAELFTHKNQSNTYGTLTAAFFAPSLIGALVYASEYGGSFLALGVPVAVVGLVHAIIEGNSSKSILSYPEKVTLEQLKLFSRFPAGKPLGINLVQLKLKESSF